MPQGQSFRDVHVDRPLTNFSIAHWQDTTKFVHQRFFNRIPVVKASDVYTTYPQGYFNRIHDSRRTEEGKANSVQYSTKDEKYSVDEDALRIFISDKKRANVDSQRNLDREATEVVTNALMLGKEKDFADKFLADSVWSKTVKGVTASPTGDQFLSWLDDAADPVQNVLAQTVEMAKRSGGRRPNKGLITLDVYMALREHPSILDRVKYGEKFNQNNSKVGVSALAELFELNELMIMETVQNVAADGIEDPTTGIMPVTNQFLASETLLLAHVPPGAGLFTATAGCTFVWNQYISQGVGSGPAMRRYRETPAIKGEYLEGELATEQHLVSADLGCLFMDVLKD